MKIKVKQLSRVYSKQNLYLAMLFLIIAGKIIRYTIMKETLVDTSIGHYMLIDILKDNVNFSFFSETGAAGNASYIFHFLRYIGLSQYIEFEIAITLFWNLILLGLFTRIRTMLTGYQIVFAMMSVIVLNIFDFNLAKEPIQMLYFIWLFCMILNRKYSLIKKYIAAICILVFSALTFRLYYVLIIFFATETFLFFVLISRSKKKFGIKKIIFIVFVLVTTYYVLLRIFQSVLPSAFAELYRVRTRQSTAASDMRVIFHSNNLILFCVDYLLMLLRMLFPIELLRAGPKYMAYVLYQMLVSYGVIKAVQMHSNNSKTKNLALYIYLGFLLASGTFEPDFGSWVRHEAVVVPLLLIINDMIKPVWEADRTMRGMRKKENR
ncbi:MAG: hypothetical protein PHY47_19385 [Lachnospiraceae bacterium]|nr:hypothetical protein [Lachnospiraceae bacterium]